MSVLIPVSELRDDLLARNLVTQLDRHAAPINPALPPVVVDSDSPEPTKEMPMTISIRSDGGETLGPGEEQFATLYFTVAIRTRDRRAAYELEQELREAWAFTFEQRDIGKMKVDNTFLSPMQLLFFDPGPDGKGFVYTLDLVVNLDRHNQPHF